MEECELCIIGAGYAGVNVLNAACHHLPPGARVVVIDRGGRWGGQWEGQYDYVRLHQPFKGFSAGAREWAFANSKPSGHLASKTEILSHFDDIVASCVAEKNIQLVQLFRYEYHGHETVGGRVQLTAQPTAEAAMGGVSPVRIVASTLFRAEGFDVAIKTPFELSAQIRSFPSRCAPRPPLSAEFRLGALGSEALCCCGCRIHSLSPADVLTPKWNALMRYGAAADAPIYVIGSGKTAMDVIVHLSRREEGMASRLHCVAGRGTYFMNRDLCFPTDR